ncbi:MAG: nucleotidyl transferase AbiEii/AbiGii toxin family protein [Ignavibacteria bacterium]|nr:nucleotidyl transferase AbiEii/AbiGii toxin family protein [Ignavibacteria bacterium]
MNSSEKFYTENLYPLQDGVLKIVRDLKIPFYLTGGTALSRFLFNHRYSDDLDFFVNDNPEFLSFVKRFMEAVREQSQNSLITIDIAKTVTSARFVQLILQKDKIKLKVDFVNDISTHFGDVLVDSEFGFIDNWANILTNKLSAIFRFETKDIVDIWVISKNFKFNWGVMMEYALQKEATINPIEVYNILKTFPTKNLSLIRWVQEPDYGGVEFDLNVIAEDLLYGKDNSLCRE